jgi:hypothetical protein
MEDNLGDLVSSSDPKQRTTFRELGKHKKGCPDEKGWVVDGAVCRNKFTNQTIVRNFSSDKISMPCEIGFVKDGGMCRSKDASKSYKVIFY